MGFIILSAVYKRENVLVRCCCSRSLKSSDRYRHKITIHVVVIPEEKNPVRNPSRTQTNVGQIHSRVGSRKNADAKSGEKIDSRNQTHGESESTRGGESDGERFSTNETFNHEVLRVKIAVTRRVVANADAEKHASDGGRDARGDQSHRTDE